MVIDPATADWSQFPDLVVWAAAADDIPEALAELERRVA